MKRALFFLLTLLPVWALAQPASHNVHFPSGAHALDAATKGAMESFMQSAAVPYPCLKVLLRGHADTDGDAEANIALSNRRVEAVKTLLLKWGIPASNVKVAAFGESKPLADNESDEGKAQNRRVEIKLAKTGGECNPLSKGVPMQDIRFEAENGLEYTYPVSGTVVKIPANALVDARGRAVKGAVTLHYREWRDVADFVFSGLPMQFPQNGSGELFHSGGMYEIKAEQNGNALSLAKGSKMEVDFALTSAERFDRFAFANGNWTKTGMDAFQVWGGGVMGVADGNPGIPAKLVPTCNETLPWAGMDSLVEFRKALHTGLNLATIKPAEAKGANAMVTPEVAWNSKLYMGMSWVGTNPETALKKTLNCIHLKSSTVKWGQRVELVDDSRQFAELGCLKGVMMILKPEDHARLKASFEGKRFCDVRVEQQGFGSGKLRLKHEKGYLEFPVLLKGVPRKGFNGSKYPGRKNRENVKEAFRAYQSALRKRARPAAADSWNEKFHSLSRPLMQGDEHCMSYAQWRNHFWAVKDSMAARYSNAIERYDLDDAAARKCLADYVAERQARLDSGLSVAPADQTNNLFFRGETKGAVQVPNWNWQNPAVGTEAMTLQSMLWNQGFGVFNCDQLQRMPAPFVLSPKFQSDSGTVKPCNTYSLFKELNGMMQGDVGHRSNETIYLSKTWTVRAVLVLGFDGKFYLAEKADLAKAATLSAGQRPLVHLVDITETANSPEKLRELLKKFSA